MAVGGFHSQAGWLAFNGIALGLVVLSRRVPLFSRVEPRRRDEPAPAANPTAAYVGPLLAIALTTMITGAVSEGGFDRLYAARVLAAVAVLWYFRRDMPPCGESARGMAVAVGLAVFAIWTALEPAPASTAAATAIPTPLARMPRSWAVSLAGRAVHRLGHRRARWRRSWPSAAT